MSEGHAPRGVVLVARLDQPLIAVLVEHDGQEAVQYFVDDAAADAALSQAAPRPAIKLAGVWSDLDADEMLASLDRIRHDSKPTPPLTSI
jgi:hypothetical protein